MLDLLISLGLWGGIRQLHDALVVRLDGLILRRKGLHCPICLSKHIWKDGHEKRKNRLPVQRYTCVACGRDFCINALAPWYHRKYSAATIILFLWYALSGRSILGTKDMCSFVNKTPTWKTLWDWLWTFGNLLITRGKRLKQNVSRYRAWQNDEMYILNRPVVGTVDPQTNTIFLTPAWRADKLTLGSHVKRVVTKWKKTPRGWWTDEWKAYHPVFDEWEEIPHHTVNHSKWKFKNSRGTTTNAIENVWRQFRRWMFMKNGLKHQAYVEFYTNLYETQHNVIINPLIMINLLF